MLPKESLPTENGERQRIMREHPFLPIFLEATTPSSKHQDNSVEIIINLSEIFDAAFDDALQEGEESLPEILANFVAAGYAQKVFTRQTEPSIFFNSFIASQIQFAYFLGGDIGNEGIGLFSGQIIESIKKMEILALDDQGQIPQETRKFFKKIMKKGAAYYAQHPHLKEMFTNSINVNDKGINLIMNSLEPSTLYSGKEIILNFLGKKRDGSSMN